MVFLSLPPPFFLVFLFVSVLVTSSNMRQYQQSIQDTSMLSTIRRFIVATCTVSELRKRALQNDLQWATDQTPWAWHALSDPLTFLSCAFIQSDISLTILGLTSKQKVQTTFTDVELKWNLNFNL